MTLGTLISTMGEYLARNITDTLALSWVNLAEKRLNQSLRCRRMVKDERLSRPANATDKTSYLLPDDYLSYRQVYDGDKISDVFMEHNPLGVKKAIMDGGDHEPMFCLLANKLMAVPSPDKLRMIYFAEVPTLVLKTDKNWLTEKYTGLILYASLAQACIYYRDEEGASLYGGMADGDIKEINEMEKEDQSLDTMSLTMQTVDVEV